jgi:threonyl-tRNA synthetase
MQNGQVAVRTRKGEDLGVMSVDAFVAQIQQDIQNRV